MTRVPFDQSAKALLEAALGTLGRASVQHEIAPGEPTWTDVWFEPSTTVRGAVVEERGLLGAMARTPALFEAFHDPPSPAEMRACVAKQLAVARGRDSLPVLWVIAAGRPEAALRALAMRQRLDWPTGIYAMASHAWLPVFIVVTSELPEGRDTLLLRLMGAGRTLVRAVREARSLPFDAWERRPAVAAITVLRSRVESLGAPEEELTMEINETYDQWEARVTREARERAIVEGKAQGISEGRAAGKAEGKAEGKTEGKAEAALRILSRRFAAVTPEIEGRVRAMRETDVDALLDRAITAASLGEALG